MTGTPEADDKESRMNYHSMVGSANCTLAKSANVYTMTGT